MTTAGRKRHPIPGEANVVRLSSNRRRGNEDARPVPRPMPPDHLGAYGLEEWERVVEDLLHLGILQRVDASALAAYCQAYDLWKAASVEFQIRRKALGDKNAMLETTKSGNIIQAPIIGVLNTARREMIRIGAEFGMTPSGRAGLHGAPKLP